MTIHVAYMNASGDARRIGLAPQGAPLAVSTATMRKVAGRSIEGRTVALLAVMASTLVRMLVTLPKVYPQLSV
ncbi:hypothetical protein DAEQUDRAFT_405936 [Daedalea quercina L-15889]|uniref:Uncharacterized protein n=1 Tax=Daedalea quercina L-15889 TaxID=1314783 RepID=A0A165NMX6_9APHY|nr:hypothetical protein DAEQUDRAFT_405936 [Daedalea quercina L-15889]